VEAAGGDGAAYKRRRTDTGDRGGQNHNHNHNHNDNQNHNHGSRNPLLPRSQGTPPGTTLSGSTGDEYRIAHPNLWPGPEELARGETWARDPLGAASGGPGGQYEVLIGVVGA